MSRMKGQQMKVVILAGGFGSRLGTETHLIPKPMVTIGGKPILWHIMKIYSHYGLNEFVILLGYKGYVVKEFFSNYLLHQLDVTIDLNSNKIEFHNQKREDWKVTLVDTGLHTMTGGRIRKARPYIGEEPFMMTYGDGVADVNLIELKAFHEKHQKAITMTVVQPDGRFGAVNILSDHSINEFVEKPKGKEFWINAGFFVCNPVIYDYLGEDTMPFEKEPLENLAKDGHLMAYQHSGFWKAMDTQRDRNQLNELWKADKAKWKIWS